MIRGFNIYKNNTYKLKSHKHICVKQQFSVKFYQKVTVSVRLGTAPTFFARTRGMRGKLRKLVPRGPRFPRFKPSSIWLITFQKHLRNKWLQCIVRAQISVFM